MTTSFIGKTISLISHSDVRYRGVLAGIDPAASTIQLSNVYSMGTESRRPPAEFIPPVQDPYQYIIFRASEVKDLAVDEAPPPPQNIHNDPAVLNASSAYPPYPPAQNFQQPPRAPAPVQQVPPQQQAPPPQQQPPQPQPQARGTAAAAAAAATNGNGLNSAAASLQTVERALGDLRVSNGNQGGRQGRHQQGTKAGDLRVPNTEFDFESANARFDKAALAGGVSGATVLKTPKAKSPANDDDAKTNPSDESDDEEKKKAEEEAEKAYNPTKSFFDSLSSSTQGLQGPSGHGGGRGRGRGAGGRNRREEERERNVATFGEPGGLGLLGPGGYVPGWGGYGRRGGGQGQGGRGRRGGGYYAGIGGR